MKKQRKAIPHVIKVRLLKETDMKCPFCGNSEAEHLEIHDIDEDPTNKPQYTRSDEGNKGKRKMASSKSKWFYSKKL